MRTRLNFRRTREVSRGQAMAEFALLLPLLALLLVMAIDFGRVFFGYVGLHNAARIAANQASTDPDAWRLSIVAGQNTYRTLVANELNGIGCQKPGGGTWAPADVPAPTSKNMPGSFSAGLWEVGDHTEVTLSCELNLFTPLAGNLVGDPVSMAARSEFPIRGGTLLGIPISGSPGGGSCLDAIVPNLVGLTVANARSVWVGLGFSGGFVPVADPVTDTEVVQTQVTSPTAYTPGDCAPTTTSILVTHSPPSSCATGEHAVPTLTGLTVNNARLQWHSLFGSGTFSPASGSNTNIVTGQTTSPTFSPGQCAPSGTTVTVTHEAPPPPLCTMPQIIGKRVNAGQTDFTTAGFTGGYNVTRPPNGNYFIVTQSLVGGQQYSCGSSVTVTGTETTP